MSNTIRKFKFNRPQDLKNNVKGGWEDVAEELWQWEAHYIDGTILRQFDDNHPLPEFGEGVFLFHQLREIDQSKLKAFKMVSAIELPTYQFNGKTDQVVMEKQTKTLLFNPKFMKLIHYYKVYGFDFMHEHRKAKIYVFGYENNVNGVSVKFLNMIMPTGEVVTTDDQNKVILER